MAALLAFGSITATGSPPPGVVRIATYNASLNRPTAGRLASDLSGSGDQQARRIAAVIQRVRPDVLLLQEFDHDARGASVRAFSERYLEVRQGDSAPIRFPYRYWAPVNTGVPSGLDLDRDGQMGGPGDAQGFGAFPGQYGMVVYSRLPLETRRVRTFQHLRWSSMPGARLPPGWYTEEALAVLRLSSKSHWDVPLVLPGGRRLHLLISHPTPPVFDGPEDRNGRRNHDEIRLWADYVSPERSAWIVDDAGRRGGLAEHQAFVVMGDQNADPKDGDSHERAIDQLLAHPRVDASVAPSSAGGVAAAQRQQGANLHHAGNPAEDTADFADQGRFASGNLRADYLLPSRGLKICGAGVFWPTPGDPDFALVDDDTARTSDHRLVWLDLAPSGACPAAQRSERSTPTGQ